VSARSLLLLLGLVFLGGAELVLRVALFHGSPLRGIALSRWVANFYGDDTFHRLLLHIKLRGREDDHVFAIFDPMLGWTARPRTPDNPLGIVTAAPYRLEDLRDRPAIIFLGDSFIAGVTPPEHTIPHRVGMRLSGPKVMNLGVPAYGLDQMFLLLRSVVDYFDHPHVVVGLLYNDVDRVAYQVHYSVKPYFEIEDGRLVGRGVPIPADHRAWLEAYPLPPRLYVLAALGGVMRAAATTRWGTEHLFFLHPSETRALRTRKTALSERLLQALRDECAERGLRLTVILFPHAEHVVHDGWYGPWLHRVLLELGIDHLDLTDALRRRVRERTLDWRRDVYTTLGHPSAEENDFFAQEITAFLAATYRYPTREPAHLGGVAPR
jgi:hypothetical protein